MDYEHHINKKLYLTVEISQLLYRHKCTYKEADEILQLITSEIQQQREELEYNTIDDYINNNKTHHVDNDIIQQLNHVRLLQVLCKVKMVQKI